MLTFFGTPQVRNQQIPQIQNVRPAQIVKRTNNEGNHINHGQQQPVAQVVDTQIQREVVRNLKVVLVNRNQNSEEIVKNV